MKDSNTAQSSQPYTLFDSHCHLDFPAFDHDRLDVLASCRKQNINNLCIPATHFTQWGQVEALANHDTTPRCHIALGLHPYFITEHHEQHLEALDKQLGQRKSNLVGIGEIGLDFSSPTLLKHRARQNYFFSEQLQLAKKHNLPVIIHSRKSHDNILKKLRQLKLQKGGIIHAYSGSEQQAIQYINLGFKLGFGGVITYPRAKKTRELVARLPLHSIVLETDAPDMPLSGSQGKRNNPDQLVSILTTFANLRAEPMARLGRRTTANAKAIFNIT